MSTDPDSTTGNHFLILGFGPFVPNIGSVCPVSKKPIRYNNVQDLQDALEVHGKHVAAFLVEPIQGGNLVFYSTRSRYFRT